MNEETKQRSETMTSYYNESNETLVKINGENFVILGNEENVSDNEIISMSKGEVPEGWATV